MGLGFILILGFLMSSPGANAACSSPTAESGSSDYSTTTKTYRMCDGTTWRNYLTSGNITTCSAGLEGALDWDAALTPKSFKFCNGSNWVRAKAGSCSVTSLTELPWRDFQATLLQNVNMAITSQDETRLYTINHYNRYLNVYGLTNPAAPTYLGGKQIAGLAETDAGRPITSKGSWVFGVGRTTDQLIVVNAATPTAMVETPYPAGTDVLKQSSYITLTPDQNYVYLAGWGAGSGSNKCMIAIYNVSNPATTTYVGHVDVSAQLVALGGAGYQYCDEMRFRGNTMFMQFSDGVLASFDATDPTDPQLIDYTVSATASQGRLLDLSPSGSYAYSVTSGSDRILTWNITTASNILFQGSFTNTNQTGAYGLEVTGSYLVVAAQTDSRVNVYSLATESSPGTTPVSLSVAANLAGPNGVTANGRYIYVAAMTADTVGVLDMGCDPEGTNPIQGCTTEGTIDYFDNIKTLGYCDGSYFRPLAQ